MSDTAMKWTCTPDGRWYRAPFIRDEHGDRPLEPINMNRKDADNGTSHNPRR